MPVMSSTSTTGRKSCDWGLAGVKRIRVKDEVKEIKKGPYF